ncbi:delta(8)-fatty-acid desaturase-like isoform X3 [Hibiscus syriacus]|uniref:delta(8)-fatty-acid desaturase-like isoform X2 n=1 Tax=Hibiscus syriacus TaxID=106335 RepID=UPI0019251101|nr:delta(8)-fatty-acid desaturase-like isoform X2 [Hibiscus syriacus]XP_039008324.1 delta(8)-fatty-acid desaturase-like isoform X3 [Hibiscus syriacus]
MEADRMYITADELKQHSKPGDLWISIQGKVYNVSDWAKEHPGGEIPLLNLAGQDVTDAFIAYHPGTAWQYLDKFFTGYYLEDFKVSEVSKDYRRLVSEFSKAGMFEKKGHVAFCSLASVAIMFVVVLYGVLICESVWAHLGSAMVLGMLWMQSTYVGHDSGHYQVMASRGYNKLAQIITGNFDPLARFLISYQHWTFYPVTCVARVNLYLQTLLLLFSPSRQVPDRALNIMGILVFWTWFPLLVSYLPNWPERIMFVLASFAVTSIQHIQFCLNHFSANVYVGPPSGNDWFEKQTSGTLDIACSSWMDWFFGGLQFQLEHHLFPRLPRCQLRKVSPVVKELCKKHNLPYRSLSFWDANVSTIRTLRTAALQARDLSNPAPKNLLWEAVNTHG